MDQRAKNIIGLVLAAAGCVATPSAWASQEVEALSTCIAQSTTGKDRNDLARWLYVAMSVHPEMKAISKVDAAAGETTSRQAGELFTRLLTESCRAQAKAAMKAGGAAAIQAAFGTLGKLAMQELMADKDVAAATSAMERYLDKKKFEGLNE